ncbi:YncE family protein [Mycolicibacterium sp.]|uniref:YncE family protein n=1 Tax=Mycolicibacterium sp. TaxID=2320850 RepID=UPI0037C7BAE9
MQHRIPIVLCVLALGCGLAAGCAGRSEAPSPSATPRVAIKHAPPAEPATAGPPTTAPIGKVVALGNAPEGVVVATSGIAAVAVRDPNAVVLFDATTGAPRQRISTPSAARHLSLATPDGPVLIPLEGSDELLEMNLADGRITATATGVGRQPHDAAQTSSGTVVVSNEGGGGVLFVRDGRVLAALPAGPPQPGGVAAVGDYAAVADVQGNGVWVYGGSSRRLLAQAPVGTKLTHAISLTGDLAAFADTDGGAVYLERIDPQVSQVAKIDAPGKPYGLAYDAARHRLYITLTERNALRVVDVADPGASRMLTDLPTVRQPNSVAVEPNSGTVLVTGSDAGGSSSVQIIGPELLPPG